MANELYKLTANQLNDLLKKKEISSRDAVLSFKERIEAVEEKVHALLTLSLDRALDEAEEIDNLRKEGENLPPLAGVPIAVKDNISTEGLRTTCASRMLENYVPVFNATVVEKLKARHMPILAKSNLDEFAFGSSTENSAFGVTGNPWDTQRVPGGSSGGSSACVSAGEAPWALGSDTGGSIRQPASLCGIVGMKPTYGLVSRYGLVAFASSLDQIGPLTRDVKDAALLMDVIGGHDPCDATSITGDAPDFINNLEKPLPKDFKIGIVKELSTEGLDAGVRKAFSETLNRLENMGAVCEEVSLPSLKYALATYYLVAPSEASSNLSRFDAVRYGYRAAGAEDIIEMYDRSRGEGFGPEAKRRIMLGTYALSAGYYEAFYGSALKVRTLIVRDFEKAFEKYSALVSPTSPTPAFRIGEKTTDPLQMYLSDICTIPANLAGIPGISIPCGLSEGLPVGFQLMGPALSDAKLLQMAYALEQTIPRIGMPEL